MLHARKRWPSMLLCLLLLKDLFGYCPCQHPERCLLELFLRFGRSLGCLMISRTLLYLLILVFFSCVMRMKRILICWRWLMVFPEMALGRLLRIGGLLSAAKRTAVLIGWKCSSVSNKGILRGWGWARISRPRWRSGRDCHMWDLMKCRVRRRSLRLEWWPWRSEQCRLFMSSWVWQWRRWWKLRRSASLGNGLGLI